MAQASQHQKNMISNAKFIYVTHFLRILNYFLPTITANTSILVQHFIHQPPITLKQAAYQALMTNLLFFQPGLSLSF